MTVNQPYQDALRTVFNHLEPSGIPDGHGDSFSGLDNREHGGVLEDVAATAVEEDNLRGDAAGVGALAHLPPGAGDDHILAIALDAEATLGRAWVEGVELHRRTLRSCHRDIEGERINGLAGLQ